MKKPEEVPEKEIKMTLENYENSNKYSSDNESNEESFSAKGINGDIQPAKGLDIDVALEAVDEQEVADDPVRLYLHEIGKVQLLTAKDERVLAEKIEAAKRIKEIKQEHTSKYGKSPTVVEIVLTMIREIGRDVNIIATLREQLNLPPADKFKENIGDPVLKDGIEGVIEQQLVQAVSRKIGEFMPETEQHIINLSLNCSLLPRVVVDAIGDDTLMSDVESLVTDNDFIDTLQGYERQIKG